MPRYDRAIVGAGLSGLAVAAALEGRAPLVIVDRLPAVGGVLGYEDPVVRGLAGALRGARVDWRLGTTALRWTDHRLLVASPTGIEWIDAGSLIICTGTRPSTAAELGLGGDRPAGVFSATVAIHLMEAGVRLGKAVVVVGASDWAARAARHLQRQGANVSVVLQDGEARRFGDRHWEGWRLHEIRGAARVCEVLLARDRFRQRVGCDAVVLGARLRPLRNVDGAVFGGEDVTYVQPVAEITTIDQVVEQARGAAASLLGARGGTR